MRGHSIARRGWTVSTEDRAWLSNLLLNESE